MTFGSTCGRDSAIATASTTTAVKYVTLSCDGHVMLMCQSCDSSKRCLHVQVKGLQAIFDQQDINRAVQLYDSASQSLLKITLIADQKAPMTPPTPPTNVSPTFQMSPTLGSPRQPQVGGRGHLSCDLHVTVMCTLVHGRVVWNQLMRDFYPLEELLSTVVCVVPLGHSFSTVIV